MKKNKVLLTILASSCVGMVAGCGETTYKVDAKVISGEYGYVTGGGKYTNNSEVKLKVYANEGCTPTIINHKRPGATEATELTSVLDEVKDDARRTLYYEYKFKLNNGAQDAEKRNDGEYVVVFECASNDESDVGEIKEAQRTVNFVIANRPEITIPAKTVKFGQKITDPIFYMEGVEGKLKWYKDYSAASGFSNEWNFSEDVVTEDITLYADVTASTPKGVVQDSVNNLVNSSKVKMVKTAAGSEETTLTISDYNKMSEGKMSSTLTASSGSIKFVVDGYNYYENYEGSFYKMELRKTSGDSSKYFGIMDIDEFAAFLAYTEIDFDSNSYTFEKSGSSYVVKKDGVEFLELAISFGKISSIKNKLTNETIAVSYPESLAGFSGDSVLNDLFAIKLMSSDAELQAAFNGINSKLSTSLKFRTGRGEYLDSIFQDSRIKPLLRKYDYTVQINGMEKSDSQLRSYVPSADTTVNIVVKGTFDTMSNEDKNGVIDKLNAGNFSITTKTTVFGTKEVTEGANIVTGENALNDENLPDGINVIVKDTLAALRDLESTYYSFDYDASTKTYSFYAEEYDSVPYLTITLDGENNLSQVTYYDMTNTNANQRNTYTSTFGTYGSYVPEP